ncbi:6-phosphofructo-2-kinase/fructose-2,6-bisphosphatase-like protein, partial [Trifolium pratense]
ALDFKFLLKPKDDNSPCFVEEGPNRVIIGGALQGGARLASFKLDNDQAVEYKVFVQASRVSSFDLAASWRAYKENFHPSAVRGIPDVSISSELQTENETVSSVGLELDLEHYVVPAPSNSARVYAANLTENPRSRNSVSGSDSYSAGDDSFSFDQPETEMEINDLDPSKAYESPRMVKSQSVGTMSTLRKEDGQRGPFVDRGVGFPRFQKSSSLKAFTTVLSLDTDTENSFPAAAGAVAAGAIADQMLGPKEDKHLAIVMVSLPARGKTFTAAKLTRYLRWLGHNTKHFNVGKYRRLKHGASQSADFFRADNPEGIEARNEVAKLAFEDMITWMQEGGQVGIFDATNSSKQRRNMLMKLAEGRCKIIFLETICNDVDMIERNIRYKIQQSPDYAEVQDFEAGLRDFKTRVTNYEKASLSYILLMTVLVRLGPPCQSEPRQRETLWIQLGSELWKWAIYGVAYSGVVREMIEAKSWDGEHLDMVNNISGYLPGRIVFFLMNTHLTPRPILLTRHGESQDNVRGRIGGDPALSEAGELYKQKLAKFVTKRLKSERAASIWTSTLQRTILTAGPIGGFPKIQWRALDEIDAGVCDGMTYEEIKKNMPEEYESRKKDKLRYRYPRGESYLDVIQRLEPVIIELERQRAPVVVVSHQAVLRALYAYFTDRPLKEIPHMEVPLHTIIEIELGVTGVQEK